MEHGTGCVVVEFCGTTDGALQQEVRVDEAIVEGDGMGGGSFLLQESGRDIVG
jgi:hypothetical protein